MSNKSITFTGNGIIKVENQTVNSYGKTLTLDGSGVELDWIGSEIGSDGQGSWLMLALSGVINVRNGAKLHFEFNSTTKNTTNALYMNRNSELKVENGASVEFIGHETSNHDGQAIQLDQADSAKISVIGTEETPSNFLIDGTNRGYVNSPEVKVENSTFTVKNCTSNASNGGKFVAINSDVNFIDNAGHGLSAGELYINNSNVTANENGLCGIIASGKTKIEKSTVEIANNKVAVELKSRWARPGALTVKANASISEDSNVKIENNKGSGIFLWGEAASLNMQSGSVKENSAEKSGKGGGIYNEGTVTLGNKVELYNNHASKCGDDIYNSPTTFVYNSNSKTYDEIGVNSNISFAPVGNGWVLDDCNHAINGWYDDSVDNRWNAHDTENLHIVEFDPTTMNFKDILTIESDTEKTEKEVAPLALKAAHPLLYKVSYVMSGEIPEKYKNKEPEQKFYAANSQYTIADTFPSVSDVNDNGVNGTFSFSGWSFTQGGAPVSGKQTLTKDVTLYGVWTFTKKNSGHRPSNPTVTIPDDVPTGLDLKNHYGYIIGYPVDYYTGKPTTDQTKKPVRPEGKITRAEVATIYFRMLTDENRAANWNQVSGFSDVKSSAWYNNAISTLTKAGILKGYEDGTFQPNGYITRAEFATIAIRFFSGVYEGEDLFPDIKGHWAEDYINNAANKGLVKGYEDGTFGPDRYITRAEAVTLVNRTLNRHPHNDGLHKDMLVWPDNMDTSKWYYADMQEATNSHEPDKNKSTADKEYWGKMLPIRDWEALEKEWSNANSAPGEGEVV